jgi:hypothetical protein
MDRLVGCRIEKQAKMMMTSLGTRIGPCKQGKNRSVFSDNFFSYI